MPRDGRSSSLARCGACAVANVARPLPARSFAGTPISSAWWASKRGTKPLAGGRCPAGARLRQGTEMLHVWFTGDLRSAYLDERSRAGALQGRPARPRLLLVQRARLSLLPAVLLALVVVGCDSQAPEHVLDGRAPADAGRHTFRAGGLRPRELRAGQPSCAAVLQQRSHLASADPPIGPEVGRTTDHLTMNGVGVTRPRTVGGVRRGRRVAIRIGPWPSGLYFARLEAADGRIGFAPFVVRPSRLGKHHVAVVMPTLTWQAYNLRDGNRDGVGDSWYACPGKRVKDCPTRNTVRLGRPFLNRGVPSRFRVYDLPFLQWLSRTGRERRLPRTAGHRAGEERGQARALLRPDRLPRPPRVRDRARVRARRGLPRSGRQSHVPLGEQLLLAGGQAGQRHHQEACSGAASIGRKPR